MKERLAAIATFVRANLLVFAIFTACVFAAVAPALGMFLASLGLPNVFLVAIFLLQGLGLSLRQLSGIEGFRRALALGAFISYGVGPALGYGLMALLDWSGSDKVGFILMCSSAPTVVSGIVIATRAGGDAALALLLTVLLNGLGIVVTPLALGLAMGGVYEVDHLSLASRLFFYVLVPSALGALLNTRFPKIREVAPSLRKEAPVLFLALTVLASLSPHSEALVQLSLSRVLGLLGPALLVHGTLLALAYYVGRGPLRIPEAGSRSLAFVSSQKSLPVALAAWSTAFASSFPLALVPVLVFHVAQIVFDSLLVKRPPQEPAPVPSTEGEL